MRRNSTTLLAAAAAAALLCTTGAARAQDAQERAIKFAFANTADSAHGIGAKRFAEVVAQKSGGKLSVKLHPGGALGGEAAVATALHWDHGFRILTNSKRPIAKLEDIQGLKIRVQQIPVFLESFNALGANAVPMPFPELYGALEAKAVDGQENPFISVEVTKFYEVQKYASTTRHAYSPLLVLTDAAEEVKTYERQVSRDLDAKAIDTLKAKGMTITEISSAERARMRDKLKPVIDKHRAASGDLGREMTAEVERIRSGK